MRDKLNPIFCPQKSACKIDSTDAATQGDTYTTAIVSCILKLDVLFFQTISKDDDLINSRPCKHFLKLKQFVRDSFFVSPIAADNKVKQRMFLKY